MSNDLISHLFRKIDYNETIPSYKYQRVRLKVKITEYQPLVSNPTRKKKQPYNAFSEIMKFYPLFNDFAILIIMMYSVTKFIFVREKKKTLPVPLPFTDDSRIFTKSL